MDRPLAATPHLVLESFDLVSQLRDPAFALHPIAPVAEILAEPVDLDAHVIAAIVRRVCRATRSTRTTATPAVPSGS